MPYVPRGNLTPLPEGHPCADCPVRPITICRGLDGPTLAGMRALGTMQRLRPEQSVFHEGDAAKRVFMVTHGALKLYTLLADGRRQITGFMFPGDFLGVSVDEEYAFTVEALEDTELWWFSREAFDLPMSRIDIADYLGLTKETVSRMLAHLRSRGLIRLQAQDRVEVLDRDGLRATADGETAEQIA